jgi:hypothetical protein
VDVEHQSVALATLGHEAEHGTDGEVDEMEFTVNVTSVNGSPVVPR